MKVRLLFLISILFMATVACSSDFEKSMNAGKEALKQEQFEEALEHFNYALIDKPNDEDALDLKNRSIKEYKRMESKKNLDSFLADVQPLYDSLAEIDTDIKADPLKIDKNFAEKNLEKAKEINDKLDLLYKKWEHSEFRDPFIDLVIADENIMSAYESVIDPPVLHIEENDTSRAAAIQRYDIATGSYITTDFKKYHTSMKSYKNYINELQNYFKKTSPAE
ncbi:hypothetical protein [Saccharibacillus sp. JS10]|uniref:hypothetical protein n=1 Tax=Saccharibacillus sp. JS10 TaxID=2950552 RepID=UPI00210A9EA8|nr:hypothetical protein [Saccharibacillus sp. JS10]MCQ4085317.1 hypothetical protein [Saccharibacillus sp. JS10]